MPKGLVNESSLNSIAEAINVLNGTEGTYAPSEMGEAIIDAIPTETASGNLIHITDAAAYPALSCVTTLEPVQTGSGDPSPENVRPITGHTGVELKHSGADTSDYETHSVIFPQEQSPVYGCEVDWVNGVLKMTHILKTMTGGSGSKFNSKGSSPVVDQYYYASNVLSSLGVSSSNWIPPSTATENQIKCSLSAFGTSTDIGFSGYIGANGSTQPRWSFKLSDGIDTVEKANAWLVNMYDAGTPLTFVWPLATPIEIPLTPEVITLLKGENNVWTNSGTSEIEYKVDLNSYIQKLIDAASASASALSVSPLSLGKSVIEPESEIEASKDVEGADEADEVEGEPSEESEKAEETPVENVDVEEDEPAELPVEEDTEEPVEGDDMR